MLKKLELENHLPLIAILRGIEPAEVLDAAKVLTEEGFTMIEVPLNSPEALNSIKLLADSYVDTDSNKYLVGAGTVTTLAEAEAVIDTGANLVVTPNLNIDVIKAAVQANCVCFPGIVTPSEAFSALAAGASGLKLFPASQVAYAGFKALKSVLPVGTLCFPVGGINAQSESMKPWLDIGANGFGLGAALYSAGMSMTQLRENAASFVAALNTAR
ncbi:2-dehydro-3-deoxy-6-phosphogalactonate aldolase [Agaribacterium sp. ZY112]|uniref:2-dehydro-3-deoxy-6-phosphogalactonate aldolase n=1 Tax=Agaribacterium sp. ZY112 TaxID=3233574 RepID=UPI0035239F7E